MAHHDFLAILRRTAAESRYSERAVEVWLTPAVNIRRKEFWRLMAEHFDQLHPSCCRRSVKPSSVEIANPNCDFRQGFPA
jgi:hypothetical protein